MEIIYPYCIQDRKTLTIGITAPSSGLGRGSIWHKRFDAVVEDFRANGHEVYLGECLIDNHKCVSATAQARAKEFMKMWFDPDIDLILPPWGGELLINILPHIDFEGLVDRPTWIQGYSDISALLMAITLRTGIATAHGTNMMDAITGQDPLTQQSRDYMFLAPGAPWVQKSSPFWQPDWADYSKNIRACFQLTEKTYWRCLTHVDPVKMSGRLIGGCLDVISRLVGSPYGDVPRFVDAYSKDEGIIFYAENSELDTKEFYRALFQLKLAGWFSQVKGIVIGRNAIAETSDDSEITYDEACLSALGDLGVPIIVDADLGHKPPQMTLINGSLAELSVGGGQAELRQKFV